MKFPSSNQETHDDDSTAKSSDTNNMNQHNDDIGLINNVITNDGNNNHKHSYGIKLDSVKKTQSLEWPTTALITKSKLSPKER